MAAAGLFCTVRQPKPAKPSFKKGPFAEAKMKAAHFGKREMKVRPKITQQ